MTMMSLPGIVLPRILRFRSGMLTACLGLVCLLLSAVPSASPAHAALIGDSSVSYEAERVVVEGGRTYVGTMHSAPGMQRHDQTINNIRMIAILRADRGVLWLVLPDFHVYTELPLSDALTRYADPAHLPQPAGREVEDGVEMRKYPIQHRDPSGASAQGFLWLDDKGIPRRLTGDYATPGGRVTHVVASLRHIRPGPQDPALFSLPQGIQMLPPQAVAPMLGLQLQ